MNAVAVIMPYRWNGLWVFDDDRVGLLREPFVAGADTLIDIAIEASGIKNAKKGFLLFFSSEKFPGADIHLLWSHGDELGNTYSWPEQECDGWLCPALFHYFDKAPKDIYIQLKERK